MQELKDRILKEGKNLGDGILKVDGFINHQVDPVLMNTCGREFAQIFKDIGATKVLALEVAGKGIRANVVAPGAINTDMLQQAYAAIAEAEGISVEEAGKNENASIPLGRPAEPSEIAAAVVFLAGPDASYITGISLPVAGGMAPGI